MTRRREGTVTSSAKGGPLTGIVMLELGQVIAGTYAGTLLSDLGADVIKVEPLQGDTARNPGIASMRGDSAIHLFMNRGKRSVSIDLKDPAGLAVFEDLVRGADVVLDNFRPGVMDRLGLSHNRLAELKPGIVSVSVSGFGKYGPSRDRPAFDLVIQAYAGHLHITGEPDGPPSRVGIPLGDLSGSVFACIAILAGLVGRGRYPVSGQTVDVAMLDSLVSLLSYEALYHLNTGEPVDRMGTAHAHMVPWQAFPVQDGYIVVAAREEKFWARLCEALERPDLIDDERSRSNPDRVKNRTFVVGELEKAFMRRTRAEWMTILEAADLPAAPVNDLAEVFADPQVEARGLVREYQHPVHGPIRYPATPMQSPQWDRPSRHAPLLGEHTVEVVTALPGYDRERVEALLAAGTLRATDAPA
jgi:crotonobetainyl-CoA:carnitine CoA-transferase CaiB-like acyl-CoA transferase